MSKPLGTKLVFDNKINTIKQITILKKILKFFEPSINACSTYFKYSFFFIIFSSVLSPISGIYSFYAPPATLIFASFIKNRLYKKLYILVLFSWYLSQFVMFHYHIPISAMIKSFGLKIVFVAIYPLCIIGLCSLSAYTISSKLKLRGIAKLFYKLQN